MDHKNHDQVFYKNFAIVLGALMALALLFAFAGRLLAAGDGKPDAQALQRLEQRIKPLGQSITDPNVLLAMAAAKPARAPYTGEQVVTKVCGACHASGLLGAPKIGDHAAWNARKSADGGLDGLVASAIKGKNQMPPKGGDAELADAEIKAAVEQMLK